MFWQEECNNTQYLIAGSSLLGVAYLQLMSETVWRAPSIEWMLLEFYYLNDFGISVFYVTSVNAVL